jgi:hypothetical protein
VVSFTLRPLYPPGKEPPVTIGEEVGCTLEPVLEPVWTIWRSENSYPHRDLNPDPSVVQPVASRYTDYAIPALMYVHSKYMVEKLFYITVVHEIRGG